MVAGLDSGGKFVDCPGVDYSPCRCRDMSKESFGQGILSFFGLSQSKSVFRVVCNRVLIAQVKDAFSRTTTRDLDRIVLNIAPFETSAIPADLLSDSRASEIRINCVETLNPLLIDENSFRSSRNVANKIEISGCDLKQQPNFAFLKGFQVLSNLKVENSSNFNSFQGIPSQLRSLSIENSRGFDNLADGSKISLPGLDRLSLNQNGFGDVTTAKILKTFAESSKESLTFLDLQENELTRIPELVSSFTKLNQLWLEFNAITSIDTPFSFSSLAPNIHLDDNAISSIKPNAFGGKLLLFSNLDLFFQKIFAIYSEGNYHIVGLNDNKLTRLDSYVFQVLLEVISRKEKSSRSSLWLGRSINLLF